MELFEQAKQKLFDLKVNIKIIGFPPYNIPYAEALHRLHPLYFFYMI